ncbi:MAG: DVU_1555 family C-GCAxxG-C-C protein [Desulfovibrionaceae bacterium]
MDDTALRMMQMAASGLCCSQIMIALALDAQDRDNPDLVRAMAGLCNGMGDCSEACGALAGGSCVIALYAARGAAHETEHERYALMAAELADWFRDTVGKAYGGVRCCQILGNEDCGQPHRERCGGIVARTFGRCLEILAANGIDPSEGKVESDV